MASSQGTWTFSLNDTDPVFNYQPYSDGLFQFGWQAGWSDLGLNPKNLGDDGSGTSYHTTSFPDANVSLSFFGTGISLLGETNCSYGIVLDGSSVATGILPSGTLYTELNLDSTTHEIILVPQPTSSSQTLNFTGAHLISPASSTPIAERIDNQNTSVITYTGSWFNLTAHQIPSSQKPSPFFLTNSSGSTASLNFTGRAIEVKGESNNGFWTYNATLDGKDYTMNSSSVWINPDSVLFYQDGLDENTTHSLTLTNIAPPASPEFSFALNSITVYHLDSPAFEQPSSSTPSSSSNTSSSHEITGGAIAGIVVGSIAGIVIALLLILWLCRRHRSLSDKSDDCMHAIDPYDNAGPSVMAENTQYSYGAVGRDPETFRKAGTMPSGSTGITQGLTSPRITGGEKQSPQPNATPAPVQQPLVPSSISPPSSTASQPTGATRPESVDRLADAVVERLAIRFSPGVESHSEIAPPSYSQ